MHAFVDLNHQNMTYHCNTHKALCAHGTWGLGLQRQNQSPVELTQHHQGKVGCTSKSCHRKVDGLLMYELKEIKHQIHPCFANARQRMPIRKRLQLFKTTRTWARRATPRRAAMEVVKVACIVYVYKISK